LAWTWNQFPDIVKLCNNQFATPSLKSANILPV